jgi:hypothetical protein
MRCVLAIMTVVEVNQISFVKPIKMRYQFAIDLPM